MKRISKKALLTGTIMGAALIAMPAQAQVADPDPDEDEVLINDDPSPTGEQPDSQIVITGTRLRANPNLQAASPVLSVSDEIIDSRAVTRIEDLTNQLPQVFAGQAGEVSNGASGTATLNLRGLGSVRTLVLIDGRRLPYGSSAITSANLDLIPTQLVEQVDILTGGASAVYGSDAVGGVANFILKRDFEGIEIDVLGGINQNENEWDEIAEVLTRSNVPVPGNSWDGEEYAITGIIGVNTPNGRGNVTLYGSYENRSAITQDNRVFSACTLSSNADDDITCAGSGNFRLFGSVGSIVPPNPNGSNRQFFFLQEDGTFVNYVAGPAQTFNFGPLNYFQRPSERYQIYARGHYDIADDIEVFADLSYTDNVSDAQIAQSASFGVYSINCDNPFLTGPIQNSDLTIAAAYGCTAADIENGVIKDNVTAAYRNIEGGPRNSRLENSAFRMVGGVRGSFASYWDFELFGQYAETSDTSISTNDIVRSNLQQAFLVTTDDDGNPVCIDPTGGCVPYNPFQRPGGNTAITQEQANFLTGVGIVVGETTQTVVGGNLQADLGNYGIRSPLSSEGIAFLVGAEYREDMLESRPDEISQIPGGGFTGVGGATLPVAGAVEVGEFFGELQVPLITDVTGFDELVLTGQYRYSDYTADGNGITTGFTTDAYGAQLSWIPFDGIKLRGQYQRSVRAPNVIELFTGQDTGLPNLALGDNGFYDPCAGPNPAASAAACANTGVTAAQYGNIVDVISGQTQGIFGGNPNLQPETSDTYTIGAVLTPGGFLSGLTLSVDYFNIEVQDFIAAGIGAQTTLDQCIATGDDAFCDLITRNNDGSLISGRPGTGFLLTNINIADLTTDGLDLQAGLDFDTLGLDFLRLDYAATYLFGLDYVPFPGGPNIQCVDRLNNDCVAAVNPSYRHIATLGFDLFDALDLNATWRYFSGTGNEPDEPFLVDNDFGDVNYLDLSFNLDAFDGFELRGGVLNVLNERPPLSTSSGPPTGNGNTYPVIYDIGRFLFLGAKVNLGVRDEYIAPAPVVREVVREVETAPATITCPDGYVALASQGCPSAPPPPPPPPPAPRPERG
ncbi:TonB-dependent receptor [Sphingomicrobium sp. XHP0239]|uniref:TonB-dependent receptor domain-containing protein n=1 Tax=Sphingomicrobium maritimum TaxID=3133972 RepID=UPI0031CC39EA